MYYLAIIPFIIYQIGIIDFLVIITTLIIPLLTAIKDYNEFILTDNYDNNIFKNKIQSHFIYFINYSFIMLFETMIPLTNNLYFKMLKIVIMILLHYDYVHLSFYYKNPRSNILLLINFNTSQYILSYLGKSKVYIVRKIHLISDYFKPNKN